MQPVSTTNGPPTRTQTPHCPKTWMWRKDGKVCSAHEDTASPEPTQSHLQFCTSRWHHHTADSGVLSYSSGEHHLTSQKSLSPKGVKLTWLHGFLVSCLPVPSQLGLLTPGMVLPVLLSKHARPESEPRASGPCSRISSEAVAFSAKPLIHDHPSLLC